MYGSDWHLISREEGYPSYLEAFDRVMQNVDKGRWRQAFFAGNAISFLRLRDRRNEPIHAKQRAALDVVLQGAP